MVWSVKRLHKLSLLLHEDVLIITDQTPINKIFLRFHMQELLQFT